MLTTFAVDMVNGQKQRLHFPTRAASAVMVENSCTNPNALFDSVVRLAFQKPWSVFVEVIPAFVLDLDAVFVVVPIKCFAFGANIDSQASVSACFAAFGSFLWELCNRFTNPACVTDAKRCTHLASALGNKVFDRFLFATNGTALKKLRDL